MDNNSPIKEINRKNTMINKGKTSSLISQSSQAYYPELIAKCFIDKMISLTISVRYLKAIETKIPNECFKFTKKIINAYLSSAFIPYERDDKQGQRDKTYNTLPLFENVDDIGIRDQTETEVMNKDFYSKENVFDFTNVFYDNYYRGENIWNCIDEPLNVDTDRFASSSIPIEKGDRDKGEKKATYQLSIDDLAQATISERERALNSRKQTRLTRDSLNSDNNKKQKAKRRPSIDFGSSDIPEGELIMNEPSELHLNDLRKEKESELKKMEEETKKITNKQIEVQQKNKEVIMKQKEYAKANITIDSKGKVIFIKKYPIEGLSNEFILPKAELKEIKKVFSVPKQPSKKKNTKENNLIQSTEAKTDKAQKEDKNAKEPNIIQRDKDKKKPTLIPVFKDNALTTLEKRIERVPINPCGSCFDLISLEIGVSFAEDKKYKTGGKDFFKAFNKYSIDNYNKQVKDHAAQPTISNHYRTATEYNYNYVLGSKYQPNLTEQSLFNFNSTTTESNNINRQYLTLSKMRTKNQNSLNPSIKVEKQNVSSLRSAIDNLDLINENQVQASYSNINPPKDIFKLKIGKTIPSFAKSKKQLEPMNSFAKSILSSEKWGINSAKPNIQNDTMRLPYKHKPKIIEVEKNINGIKESRNYIQRERLKNAGINAFYSSMDALNNKFLSPNKFFKR